MLIRGRYCDCNYQIGSPSTSSISILPSKHRVRLSRSGGDRCVRTVAGSGLCTRTHLYAKYRRDMMAFSTFLYKLAAISRPNFLLNQLAFCGPIRNKSVNRNYLRDVDELACQKQLSLATFDLSHTHVPVLTNDSPDISMLRLLNFSAYRYLLVSANVGSSTFLSASFKSDASFCETYFRLNISQPRCFVIGSRKYWTAFPDLTSQ